MPTLGLKRGNKMETMYTRTEMLIGDSIDKIKNSKVIVFGVGGVGGYAVESLARVGIGSIDIVDSDCFSISNLNRQILATIDTVGKKKVDVAKDRIKSINPNCIVNSYDMFYDASNKDQIDLTKYDYVIDAIDTVTSKLLLIEFCKANNINIISSMGTGNKIDCNFKVADIYKTNVCPLAKVMRKELKTRGIKDLKVVYSEDEVILPSNVENKRIPGSISYAPAIAGLLISSEVIKDLIK